MPTETEGRWGAVIRDSSVDLYSWYTSQWLGGFPGSSRYNRNRRILKLVILSKVHGLTPEQAQSNLLGVLQEEVELGEIEDLTDKFVKEYPQLWA